MPKEFKFKHNYFKLDYNVFPTVRGRYSFKKYFEDEEVQVLSPKNNFNVMILSKEIKSLSSLSSRFILLDGSYESNSNESFMCTSIEKYITLLNSFRRFYPIEKLTEEVSIFWLEKVPW